MDHPVVISKDNKYIVTSAMELIRVMSLQTFEEVAQIRTHISQSNFFIKLVFIFCEIKEFFNDFLLFSLF